MNGSLEKVQNVKCKIKNWLSGLRIKIRQSVALGLVIALFTVFVAPKPVLAAAGDGLLSYGSGTATIGQKYYRWTPSSWTGPTAGPVASVTTNWTVMKSSPTRAGERIMAMVTTQPSLKVYRWNGSSWSSEWADTPSAPSATQITYRGVDVAYENTSGNVLVVYTCSTSATTVYWRKGTWGGSSYTWTSGSFTFATTIGNIRWLRLATRLNTNEMTLAATGDNATNQINARIWDGSTFGTEAGALGLINGALAPPNENFDAAYETTSGKAMVLWGISGSPYCRCVTHTAGAGSWNAVQNGPTSGSITGNIRELALDGDPTSTSNYIAAALIEDQSGDDANGAIWDGSSWITVTSVDTGVYSTVVGRDVDIKYVGTTSRAVMVFNDTTTADLDWTYWNGTTYAGSAYNQAITGATYDDIIQLTADANSNTIMFMRGDSASDLYSYYYNYAGNSWSNPGGGDVALETTSSGGTSKESFMFAYESVYSIPTLGMALTVIAVASFIAVLVRRRILKLRRVEA